MKRTITTLLLALLCFTALQAQNTNKEIEKIRKNYNATKADIAKLQKEAYDGKLYCMHLEDNVYGKSYPATGTYNEHYWFYYDFGEDDAELKMVIITSKISANTIYKEYMYNKGELVFAYEKNSYDNNVEKRLYQSNGKIIRYTENNVENTHTEAEDTIAMINKLSVAIQKTFGSVINRD